MFHIFFSLMPVLFSTPPYSKGKVVIIIANAFIQGFLYGNRKYIKEMIKAEVLKAKRDIEE